MHGRAGEDLLWVSYQVEHLQLICDLNFVNRKKLLGRRGNKKSFLLEPIFSLNKFMVVNVLKTFFYLIEINYILE